LNELRISKAKEMLMKGGMKCKDVANAVGYAEPGYFNAVFRKLTGKSPNEFCEATNHTE